MSSSRLRMYRVLFDMYDDHYAEAVALARSQKQAKEMVSKRYGNIQGFKITATITVEQSTFIVSAAQRA